MAARRPGFELTLQQRLFRFVLPAIGLCIAIIVSFVRESVAKPKAEARKAETLAFAEQLAKDTPAETDLMLLEARVSELALKRQTLWGDSHWDITAVSPLTPLALKTRFEELETKIRQDGMEKGVLLPDKLTFLEKMPGQDESLRQSARLLVLLRMREVLFDNEVMALEKLDASPVALDPLKIEVTLTAVCPMRNLPKFLNALTAKGMSFVPASFKVTRIDGAGGAFRVEAALQAEFTETQAPKLPEVKIPDEEKKETPAQATDSSANGETK